MFCCLKVLEILDGACLGRSDAKLRHFVVGTMLAVVNLVAWNKDNDVERRIDDEGKTEVVEKW